MNMDPLGWDDREVLKSLATMGNDEARDRLADLAFEQRDVGELSVLLDDGYERAGDLLTDIAIGERDLVWLQELGDAGIPAAQEALGSLLQQPG